MAERFQVIGDTTEAAPIAPTVEKPTPNNESKTTDNEDKPEKE